MTDSGMDFSATEQIGRVASVDTSRVLIDVDDHTLITRMSVSNIIAVQGTTTNEYLIGIVDRIVRTTRQEALLEEEDEEGNIPVGEAESDVVRAVLIGTYRKVDGERRNVFKRGADSFPQIDRACFLVEAANLQQLMTLSASELPESERLKLGRFVADQNAMAVADGNRFFQRHAALLGSTGSGKSWSVALILERASALKYPNILVFDIHGEYRPLTSSAERPAGIAAGYRIAGPGDIDQPGQDSVFLPYWLLNHEEMLALLLDRSDQNAPNQASRFSTHVRALKEKTLRAVGQDEVLRTFTVDSPIPYSLPELIKLLEQDDQEMVAGARGEKQGPFFGKLTRFITRLQSKVGDRRYGFLFQPPSAAIEYQWLAEHARRFLGADTDRPGIKVIDFSEVPSDVLPIVTGVFARVLYDVQFWTSEEARAPFAFVCDEAHQYLPVRESTDATQARALEVFERIAKEGRKYGVSLLVVSQRPSDVNRTILSQCNNFLVLRLTNDQDQMVVRRLIPDSMGGLIDVLPLLDVGEALLLGDAVVLPARLRLYAPRVKPDSATRDFWSEWGSRKPDLESIDQAVECMRRQLRASANLQVDLELAD
jgi:uncharacterized protein